MKASSLPASLQQGWIVYLVAVLASLVLSAWIGLRETVINPDGICYLETAATIGKAGLQAAAQLCDQAKWPFYPFLIYGFVKLTHISYLNAAWVLNSIFSLTTVVAFMTLVRMLGGTQRIVWLAAFVILFAHEFAGTREYIIRDHGFWAFYLMSVLVLVRYFRAPRWQEAMLWPVCIVLATLFRIEGVLFLLFMPLLIGLDTRKKWQTRLAMFLQLNSLSIVLGLVALGWMLFSRNHYSVIHLSRLDEVRSQLHYGIFTLAENFQTAATQLAQNVLNSYSAKDAGTILSLLLISWYGFSLIANVSLLYGFLILYAGYRKLVTLDKPAQFVLWGYIAINILVTTAYLAENLFISKRYLIALSLLLMVWVPFACDKIIAERKQHPSLFALLLILFTVNATSTLIHFGYSKDYLRNAGDWLAQNVPQASTLYANDEQVMYYSQHFGDTIFARAKQFDNLSVIANRQWQQYDYVALRINHHEAVLITQEISSTPVKIFANKRGDKVIIYKISHQEIQS
jgi:hypothetical protein